MQKSKVIKEGRKTSYKSLVCGGQATKILQVALERIAKGRLGGKEAEEKQATMRVEKHGSRGKGNRGKKSSY